MAGASHSKGSEHIIFSPDEKKNRDISVRIRVGATGLALILGSIAGISLLGQLGCFK